MDVSSIFLQSFYNVSKIVLERVCYKLFFFHNRIIFCQNIPFCETAKVLHLIENLGLTDFKSILLSLTLLMSMFWKYFIFILLKIFTQYLFSYLYFLEFSSNLLLLNFHFSWNLKNKKTKNSYYYFVMVWDASFQGHWIRKTLWNVSHNMVNACWVIALLASWLLEVFK